MAESKSVFDAVNSALEELTPGVSNAATTTNEDAPASNPYADAADAAEDQDTELGVDEAGDEVGEEGGKTETSDGEDAGKDEGAAGKPDGADGKPADGKGDTDEAKAAAEAAAAKKPDAVNDPIPKDVAPATQERIRTLIKATKEAETAKAEATQNLDYIVNGVRATGMNPQQYGEVLSFMQLFNSGDPNQQSKALELVENLADQLAALLGKERTASDPLKGFPDLAQAVQQGQMTRQWAAQLATSRRQTQTRSQIETSVRTTQEQEQQQKKERAKDLEDARVAMNNWELSMGRDPQFAQLKDRLVRKLKPDFQKLSPKEWLPRFQQAFEVAKLAAGPVRSPDGKFQKGHVPENQPLRARNPAGGGAHAPKNMQDAVFGAIADLAGSRR